MEQLSQSQEPTSPLDFPPSIESLQGEEQVLEIGLWMLSLLQKIDAFDPQLVEFFQQKIQQLKDPKKVLTFQRRLDELTARGKAMQETRAKIVALYHQRVGENPDLALVEEEAPPASGAAIMYNFLQSLPVLETDPSSFEGIERLAHLPQILAQQAATAEESSKTTYRLTPVRVLLELATFLNSQKRPDRQLTALLDKRMAELDLESDFREDRITSFLALKQAVQTQKIQALLERFLEINSQLPRLGAGFEQQRALGTLEELLAKIKSAGAGGKTILALQKVIQNASTKYAVSRNTTKVVPTGVAWQGHALDPNRVPRSRR